MNILLTNDDGFDHIGLTTLYSILKDYGNVTIVAPKNPQSAKSASITITRGLGVVEYKKDYFHVDGTPADCVKVALFALNRKFDLVISGCNDGHNISYDTSYSGTVGACLEAQFHSVPAIAFSTDFDHFGIVEKETRKVLDYIFKHNLTSKDYLLNVNFPIKKFPESKGIKLTDLYMREDNISFAYKDGIHYASRDSINGLDVVCDGDNCDYKAVYEGYISITPLKPNYFDDRILKEVKNKVKKSK